MSSKNTFLFVLFSFVVYFKDISSLSVKSTLSSCIKRVQPLYLQSDLDDSLPETDSFSTVNLKTNSQIAKLNAKASQLRAEAALLEVTN